MKVLQNRKVFGILVILFAIAAGGAIFNKLASRQSSLSKSFDLLDKDGNGYISKAELERINISFSKRDSNGGIILTDNSDGMKRFFDQLDGDKDSQVSKWEFVSKSIWFIK